MAARWNKICDTPGSPSYAHAGRGSAMSVARIGIAMILGLSFICLPTATRAQKMTVTGKLVRVAAIGGESTGLAIQLDSEITIDGKHADSVEIAYSKTK